MDLFLLSIGNIISSLGEMLTSPSFWIKTVGLLASLSILVFVHELGHYTWARTFGIKVDKFCLFFDPWLTLLSWKPGEYVKVFDKIVKKRHEGDDAVVAKDDCQKSTWRDTEYGLGWLPLGGYCSIAGMIDETQGADKLKGPAKPWEFRSKSTIKRLFVMIGGVLNNFLLALVVYAGMVYCWGEEFLPIENATDGYEYSDSAHKIGFVDGDIPLTADGQKLEFLDGKTLQSLVTSKRVTVLRNGSDTVTIAIPQKFIFTANKDAEKGTPFITLRIPVVIDKLQPRMGAEKAHLAKGDHITAVNGNATPSFTMFTQQLSQNKGKAVKLTLMRQGKSMDVTAQLDENGKLGFQLANPLEYYKTIKKQYNIFQSIPRGIKLGCDQMVNYVSSLKLIFTKEGAESLGSFGAIGSLFPDTWNWYSFWNITAFLSIILAVMNILPIPALDGGHVLFLIYEMIFRRKPSDKFLERAQTVGMIFLMLLMVYAFGNDIYRFLIK